MALRSPGRPPRVTPTQIAEAALAVGLDRASVRNVADALGMSVPGLYHHVKSRGDIIAIATVHSFRALKFPPAQGKSWSTWLLEYAQRVFDDMIARPELIRQIILGNSQHTVHAQHLERFLEILIDYGFSVGDAYRVYVQVMSAIIGAAALQAGEQAAALDDRSMFLDLAAACDLLPEWSTPLVRRLVGDGRAGHPNRFDAVRTVVNGLLAEQQRSPKISKP